MRSPFSKRARLCDRTLCGSDAEGQQSSCSIEGALSIFILIFYAAIICFSWYTFCFVFGPLLLGYNVPLAILLYFVFHILLIFQIWPYAVCVLRDPGSVSKEWAELVQNVAREALRAQSELARVHARAANEGTGTARSSASTAGATSSGAAVEGAAIEMTQLADVHDTRDTHDTQDTGSELHVMDIPLDFGTVRWCDRCQRPKPDRCHHCSVCNRCVLKMDHHCPWLANCVGYRTYKYFVQMLLWSFVLCTFFPVVGFCLLLLDTPTVIQRMLILINSVLVCSLGLGSAMLLFTHLYFIAVNKSTLESDDSSRSPYDRGSVRKNFEAVCGRQMWKWLWVFSRPFEEYGGVYYPRWDREGHFHQIPSATLATHLHQAQTQAHDDATAV